MAAQLRPAWSAMQGERPTQAAFEAQGAFERTRWFVKLLIDDLLFRHAFGMPETNETKMAALRHLAAALAR